MKEEDIPKKVMKELIKDKLLEKGRLRQIDLQRELEYERKRRSSFMRVIGEMETDEEIIVERVGKAKYIEYFESKQIARQESSKLSMTSKEIPLELKSQHHNDIKEVIRRWIWELKDIPYIHYRGSFEKKAHTTLKYPVESDPLFPYIKPHLTFNNDLFKKWKDFKERFNKYENGKRELYSSICIKLSDKLQIEISDRWRNREMIHYGFPDLVYQALIELGRGDEDDYNSFLSFESRVGYDKKQGLGRYWVNANGFVIFKMSGNEEEHKERMDNYVRTTLKGLRGSQLEKKMIKLMVKEGPLNKLKEEIVQILNRNLKVPLFGGECEICRKLKTIL